jgi:hypothetical protein
MIILSKNSKKQSIAHPNCYLFAPLNATTRPPKNGVNVDIHPFLLLSNIVCVT